MQKWIMVVGLGLFYSCQQNLDRNALMLEGQLVTASLAQSYIDNNDLVILYSGNSLTKTICDTVVSRVMEVRNLPVISCLLHKSQDDQIKEFNGVMTKELWKRGIEDYWGTYRKEVLDCKAVLEYEGHLSKPPKPYYVLLDLHAHHFDRQSVLFSWYTEQCPTLFRVSF